MLDKLVLWTIREFFYSEEDGQTLTLDRDGHRNKVRPLSVISRICCSHYNNAW